MNINLVVIKEEEEKNYYILTAKSGIKNFLSYIIFWHSLMGSLKMPLVVLHL